MSNNPDAKEELSVVGEGNPFDFSSSLTLVYIHPQCSFFFSLRFYLFMRERERGRDRQMEKQAPCRKPNVGLDPGTPVSSLGLEAGPKPLSHPEIHITCL